MDISRCWNANMQLLIPTPTKLHISKTAAQNGQQPEIAMPSIFISNVMPRMPQLFGAVRIGPTRASENPGKGRYRRSGDAEFEVLKSYKRHQTGAEKSSVKKNHQEKQYTSRAYQHCLLCRLRLI
jgi:hypothetical protein